MGFFQPDKGPFLVERRAARRTRATCAASLRTLSNETFGHLWDLSQTGARVSVEKPPEPGENAMLKWGGEKAMCQVIWVEHDMCGLAFDSPINPEVVESSARLIGIVEQPTAAIGNIPVGQKRSGAGTSTGEAESESRRFNPLAIRKRPTP
jgi:hypothetical protein